MLENEKLAFVAGIFEGEGTFSIAKGKDKRCAKDYFNFHPCLAIVNSDIKLLEFCQSVVGGRIYEKKEPKGSYPIHGKVFDLRITGLTKVSDITNKLLPFLISKKREAELLNEYCLSRLNRGGTRKPYTIREKEIYRILKGMHKKGRALQRSYANGTR